MPDAVLVSPDGSLGVLTKEGNLWLRDMAKETEKPLTQDGEPHFGYGVYYDGWKAVYIPNKRVGKPMVPMESYWSPDSSKVIVTRVDQRHVAEYPILETTPADGTFRPKVHMVRLPLVGEKPATVEWFVFDITRARHRRIELPYDKLLVMQQDILAVRKSWFSSDSEHLYAVAFGDNMGMTMMACPDMAIEMDFMEAMRRADNYAVSTDELSLNKARMAPLARFSAASQ